MCLVRILKTKYAFHNGSLQTIKIIEANDDEMVCSNGTRIKIIDSWKSNLGFSTKTNTGEIDHWHGRYESGGYYVILKNGQFIGIIVTVCENGDMWATDVITGQSATGWSGGNVVDYCKKIMATDFAVIAEWGVNR